jgi:hypothetical protein
MRALAVLSVIEGPLIRELAVYTVTEQSTLSARWTSCRPRADPPRDRCRPTAAPSGSSSPSRARAFETLWPHMARRRPACSAASRRDERAPSSARLQKMLANIRKHEI